MLYQNLSEKIFAPLITPLLDFIFPPYCLFCQGYLESYERLVCLQCWRSIQKLDTSYIEYNLESGIGDKEWFLDASLAVWEYDEKVQQIIHLFKYNRMTSLGKMLGLVMAGTLLTEFGIENDSMLIPVPLHRVRQRERGYNQSEILARTISKLLSITVSTNHIRRIKNTKPQVKLNAMERVQNVASAFALKNRGEVANKKVILVDDVFTTGTTLNECAKILKGAGVKYVLALTTARA